VSLAKPPPINWDAVRKIRRMRELMAGLPIEQRQRADQCERELRAVMERYGEEARWAFSIVGMEIAYEP
jgi:hypothetical protein